MVISGWTKGWQAPEIDSILDENNGGKITVAEYYQADMYSLGLVMWSTFCNSGKTLEDNTKHDASARAMEAMEAQEDVPPPLKCTVSYALDWPLCYEPLERPSDPASLLFDRSESYYIWHDSCQYLESIREKRAAATQFVITAAATQGIINLGDKFAPQNINRFHTQTLDKAFKDFADDMSDGELFSIFLHQSYTSIRDGNISVNSSFIQALLRAAKKDFVPAQAIAYRVLQSHNIEWPDCLMAKKISWLYQGAAIGCQIALSDLENLDPEQATRARQTFRVRGGLLQIYATLEEQDIWKKAVQSPSLNSQPCEAEGVEQLKIADLSLSVSEEKQYTNQYWSSPETGTQDLGIRSEDLLYLACVAGSTGLVQRLCAQECDASVTGTSDAISCLHWLFTFPPEDVDDIAATLIRNGADIDAQLNTAIAIPNVNFPYSRPPGTPLHWATASSNIPAVLTLLKYGADLGIRNGEDPYKHNRDVRELLHDSRDYSVGLYSVPTQPCQGLTALDVAAANHDWKLLHAIFELTGAITIANDDDEEGYTAFHRLEHNCIGRTWMSTPFWYPPILRSCQHNYEPLILTIQALADMGGNINQLTTLSDEKKTYFPGNMTPLMLAVRQLDLPVINGLLAWGADPNVRNEHGLNALSMLPDRGTPEVSSRNIQAVCDLLIQHGTEVTAPPDCYGGLDPLACAIKCTDLGVVRAVLKAGAPTRKSRRSKERRGASVAAQLVDELQVRNYFADNTKLTRNDWDLRCGNIVEILREYFLVGGAEDEDQLYGVDPEGGTLLHNAVASGSLGVVEYLLGQDIEPNVYRQRRTQFPNRTSRRPFLDFGTPLDVCMMRIEQLKMDSGLNEVFITPQSYTLMLNCYYDIQKMLQKNGGRNSDIVLKKTEFEVLQIEPALKEST